MPHIPAPEKQILGSTSYTAYYGFPHYKTVGWIFKEKVPNGWEDRGEVSEEFVRAEKGGSVYKYAGCDFCRTKLHIGIENAEAFKFCPKCLVKRK